MAQISMTALSLDKLSQAHWVARGFLVVSLTLALMAVCYSTAQNRTMGRLLSPRQIRQWIRGNIAFPDSRQLPPVEYALTILHSSSVRVEDLDLHMLHREMAFVHDELNEDGGILRRHRFSPTMQSFIPSVASVITVAAPQVLLSTSLIFLLVALGVYFGFVWTSNLDTSAGVYDNRNVFIFYLVGLLVCFVVYSLSHLVQEANAVSNFEVLETHYREFLQKHMEKLLAILPPEHQTAG